MFRPSLPLHFWLSSALTAADRSLPLCSRDCRGSHTHDLLVALGKFKTRPPWKKMALLLEQFAGINGRSTWSSVRAQLLLENSGSTRSNKTQVMLCGISGIADSKKRKDVSSAFDNSFGELLADYVFTRRVTPNLDVDQSNSVARLIAAIADDHILTTPRTSMVRRVFSGRSPLSRAMAVQQFRLLELLMDMQCGVLAPELVAIVLASCLRSDESPPEIVRTALGAIKTPPGRSHLFLPGAMSNSQTV